MAALTIAELKTYLRVDGDADDDTIAALMLAAEQYMTNAGVTVDYANRLTGLCVKQFCAWQYDHRGDDSAPPQALTIILEQLRISTDSATAGEWE